MRAWGYLPLPKELKAKQGCLNVQNNDEKCFLWSILALLHPVQHKKNLYIVSKYQEYEHELNISEIQYHLDIKNIGKFEYQNNISVKVFGYKDKKSSHYVLPPWPLQDITLIYYISLLMKNLITYWWKTWADWYRDNIVCMAVLVKKYWKTIWKDASYMGHKESTSQELTTRRDVTKSKLQKQNSNYVFLLWSTQISQACHVNKTPVSHYHQNPSPPNTSIKYHVGAASTWNVVMAILWTIPNEYGRWHRWKVFGPSPSLSNHV